MPATKHDALKRSQLLVRLWGVESQLLAVDVRGKVRIKSGSTRDRELRAERTALLQAIKRKDEALLEKWRAGWTHAQG